MLASVFITYLKIQGAGTGTVQLQYGEKTSRPMYKLEIGSVVKANSLHGWYL